MKRLFTFLLALMLITLGANAQTVIHECVAETSDWTATFTKSSTNPNDEHFVQNTWSTEDDGTGMTAPFLEYWAGGGYNLDDATIVHETLADLPNGYYNVSVFARLYNENNSTAPGAKEIYFHANEESVDLATGTPTSYGSSAVIYGTYTLLVYLEEAGNIEISFTVDSETSCDWLAFKNLSVEYLGATMPTLDYVTGTMNAAVETAMQTAVDQYNTSKSSADYLAALEAIEAAEESVAYYAPIVAAVNALDTDGAAVWAESDYATMLTERSLTDEDVSADLAAAQKAQTTANTDWSYVLTSTGTWSSSNHPAFDPSTTFEVYGEISEGRVIYKTVSDLPAGTYTVSFYGAASLNNEYSVTSVTDGASVYANEASETIDINNLTGVDYANNGWPEDELYTFECTVDLTGTLEFGVSAGSQDNKGKWYIAKAVSLTLDELYDDPYVYDVTKLLANPSFEEDNVSEWEADTNNDGDPRCNNDNKGAWIIPTSSDGTLALTGWSLKRIGTEEVFDLMTKEAIATDNNLGAPGEASDGDYMLYIKKTWGTEDDQVSYVEQTVTLPAGEYKLTVDSKFFSNAATARLVAGDEGASITVNGTSAPSADDNLMANTAWTTNTLEFTVEEDDTEVTLGVEMTFANSGLGSLLLDNFQLFSTEKIVITVDDDEYTEGDVAEIDGVEYNVLSDNMVVNGSFNDGVDGWTAGDGSTTNYVNAADPANFTLETEGGFNDGAFITTSAGGYTSVKTLTQAIAVEAGKTYLFIGYNKGTTPTTKNQAYNGLMRMSDATTEVIKEGGDTHDAIVEVQMVWGAEAEEVSETWTKTEGVFTAETDYVGVRFAWCNASFDGIQLYEVEAVEETIEWEMTDAGWGTMILPFDAEIPSGLTLYAGSALELSSDGTTITVGDASTSIVANTPYLVNGTAGEYTFTGAPTNTEDSYTVGMLTGTLVDMTQDDFTADGTEYVLQNHTDDGEGLAFYPIISGQSTGVTLNAYHCYLTSDVTPLVLHLPGMATAIEAVESDVIANGAIYDLSGRKVSKAVKGVYIQNGKKVLVK